MWRIESWTFRRSHTTGYDAVRCRSRMPIRGAEVMLGPSWLRSRGCRRRPSFFAAYPQRFMISVSELDNIARARIEDAKALLTAGRYDGATYLGGYAVEIALKARICRTLNWTEFPSTGSEFQAYRSFQTHELAVLLRLSGQEARIKQNHFSLWNAVAIWKVELRYNVAGTVQQPDATAMIQAAEGLVAAL
jgi:hypothetical protein